MREKQRQPRPVVTHVATLPEPPKWYRLLDQCSHPFDRRNEFVPKRTTMTIKMAAAWDARRLRPATPRTTLLLGKVTLRGAINVASVPRVVVVTIVVCVDTVWERPAGSAERDK